MYNQGINFLMRVTNLIHLLNSMVFSRSTMVRQYQIDYIGGSSISLPHRILKSLHLILLLGLKKFNAYFSFGKYFYNLQSFSDQTQSTSHQSFDIITC